MAGRSTRRKSILYGTRRARPIRNNCRAIIRRRNCGTTASSIPATPATRSASRFQRRSTRRSASPAMAYSGSSVRERASEETIMGNYEDISARRDGAIVRIAVERPAKLNAYRNQTADELLDAFVGAERDEGVRVAILTGAGRAFGAGYDLATVEPETTPSLDDVLEKHFNPLVRPI